MTASPSRRVRGSALVACTALLAGLLAGVTSSAAAAPSPQGERDRTTGQLTARAQLATRAYLRAKPIFASDERDEETHDATVVLRDLKRYADALTVEQRAEMKRWNSKAWKAANPRPANSRCAENKHAVIHCDDKLRGFTPKQARKAVGAAHRTYRQAGYKAPLKDRGNGRYGPNKKVDVYFTDLGVGLFGYCTTDQPADYDYGVSVWSYCVLNSDYSWSELPPAKAMRVTVAHEYFHAVQFAYDLWADGWFMESTATWAEERARDRINDNRAYLQQSPMSHPALPLTRFQTGSGQPYGSWIWWEYLAQRFGKKAGGMETIVRDTWRRSHRQGIHSLRALRLEVKKRGARLPKVYAAFADANRRPRRTYPEGRAPAYSPKPVASRTVLRKVGASHRFVSRDMRQLSGRTYTYKPRGLQHPKSRLRLRFDLPPRRRAGMAVVSLYFKNGKVKTRHANLGKKGNGGMVTDFSARRVKRVEVTLVNASSQMVECRQHFTDSEHWPCDGLPRHNATRGVVKGTVFRR